jgi:hypothetical protein
MDLSIALKGIGALAFLVFWVIQLLDLMRRRDDEFPGRFDKPIWAAMMIFLLGFGAFIYWLWKPRQSVVDSPDSLKRELAAIKNQQKLLHPGEAGQAS